MTERWLPVIGWEGRYEVSDQGRVRSLPHSTVSSRGIRRSFPGRLLKPIRTRLGYPQVNLKAGQHAKAAHIHGLVLEAFVGPRPDGMQGCHFDGDRSNNVLTNLRWDTPLGNAADAARHGTHRNRRRTHCKNGHPFDEQNTYVDYKNRRVCLTCNKAWRRERLLIKKAQATA